MDDSSEEHAPFQAAPEEAVQFIREEPEVADLLVTIYLAAAHRPRRLDATAGKWKASPAQVAALQQLPAMRRLAACEDDAALKELIRSDTYDALREILLSKQPQASKRPGLKWVPKERREASLSEVPMFVCPHACREDTWSALNDYFEHSQFLFHGSAVENWRSIWRHGMMVSGGNAVTPNGQQVERGLRFVHKSDAAFRYSDPEPPPGNNLYLQSELGRKIWIMAVCDVATLPEDGASVDLTVGGKVVPVHGMLKRHDTPDLGRVWVLTAPEAAVVRALLVVEDGSLGCGQLRNGVESSTLRDPLKKFWEVVTDENEPTQGWFPFCRRCGVCGAHGC